MHVLKPKYWVQLYADYLLQYAMLRINDQTLCEDLVQETFLSALKAKDQFKGNAHEKTWLTTILKNKIIDEYRKKAKTFASLEDDDFDDVFSRESEEQSVHWSSAQRPEIWDNTMIETMTSKEYYHVLYRCMAKLNDKHRELLQEKYFEESSTEKICKDFNISSSNYWTSLHRINIQLRKCIEKNWIFH